MRSEIQRRIARSKQSERDLGKWLLEHDGPDPLWQRLTSSTGRVGHITNLQFDVVSATYAAENKQMRLPVNWMVIWLKILEIAAKHGKEPLLVLEPTNALPNTRTKIPKWHVITQDRHAELLRIEKEWMNSEDT